MGGMQVGRGVESMREDGKTSLGGQLRAGIAEGTYALVCPFHAPICSLKFPLPYLSLERRMFVGSVDSGMFVALYPSPVFFLRRLTSDA